MPTPADQRLLDLLEKWLKSLELHAKYAGLDSDSYWKVQPWPEHQRPSRWIIDLASQKAAALKAQVLERIARELERSAEAKAEPQTQADAHVVAHRPAARGAEHRAAATGTTSVTREMP